MNLSIRTRSGVIRRAKIGRRLTRFGFRSGTNAIPYTKQALERDLERVRNAWDDSHADRRRDAIYGYFKAVYDLGGRPKGVRFIERAKLCVHEGWYLRHVKTSTPP
jgi:hypothetical protein